MDQVWEQGDPAGKTLADEVTARRRSTARRRLRRRLVSLAVVAGAWQLASMFTSPIFLPSIPSVVASFGELVLGGELFRAYATSLPAMLIGFFLAVGVALTMGVVMGTLDKVEKFFDVYLTILLVTPTAALVPIIIIAMGLSMTARIFVVFLFCVVYMTVNTIAAIRSVRPELVEMASSFNLSWLQRFRWIVMPSAAPLIMAGVRLGYARALVGMLISELIIINVGLGELLLDKRARFQTDDVFAVIFSLLIFAVTGGRVILSLDAHINRWHHASHGQEGAALAPQAR